MAAVASAVRQALAGISPRERKLLLVLGLVLGVLLFGGIYWWASSAVDDIESQRAATVDALRTIRDERPRIRARQAARDAMIARYREPAPALTSFVESAAREANVTVVEATDRPAPTGTAQRFQRRAVSIRLRRVDLQSLLTFMNRIESAQFPVAITSIRIRKRFGESNSYDVDDMVISTWDRNASAPVTGTRRTGTSGGTTGTRQGASSTSTSGSR